MISIIITLQLNIRPYFTAGHDLFITLHTLHDRQDKSNTKYKALGFQDASLLFMRMFASQHAM